MIDMIQQELIIDIDKKGVTKISSVKGDQISRGVNVSFIQKGIPFNLEGLALYLYTESSAHGPIFKEITIIDHVKGTAFFHIPSEIASNKGTYKCCVAMRKDKSQLLSYNFMVVVDDSAYNENGIVNSDDFSVLLKALSVVDEYAEALENAALELDSKYTHRLNDVENKVIESNMKSDSAVVDATKSLEVSLSAKDTSNTALSVSNRAHADSIEAVTNSTIALNNSVEALDASRKAAKDAFDAAESALQASKDASISMSFSDRIDEIANTGTTVDVIERVTKEELDRQLADGNINNMIKDYMNDLDSQMDKSKTDYFGEDCKALDVRLNKDFDNIHQKLNDSTYLDYSGEYITADNSYYGEVRNIGVKGRTIQNLYSKSDTWIQGGNINYPPPLGHPAYKYLPVTLTRVNGTYRIFGRLNTRSGNRPDAVMRIGISNFTNSTNRIIYNTNHNTHLNIDITVTLNHDEYIVLCIYGMEFERNYPDFMIYRNSEVSHADIIDEPSTGIIDTTSLKMSSIGLNKFTSFDVKSETANIWFDGVNSVIVTHDMTNQTGWRHARVTKISVTPGQQYNISCVCEVINGHIRNAAIKLFDYRYGEAYTTLTDSNGFKNTFTSKTNTVYVLAYSMAGPFDNEYPDSEFRFSNFSISTDDIEYASPEKRDYDIELSEPLRALPSGICDEIKDGMLIRRVGKVVLDPESNYYKYDYTPPGCSWFSVVVPNLGAVLDPSSISRNVRCNILPNTIEEGYRRKYEGIAVGVSTSDQIRFGLNTSRLGLTADTISVDKLKEWLSSNTVEVYYALKSPVVTPIETPIVYSMSDQSSIFIDTRYKPTISCSIPSNVNAVVTDLRSTNAKLASDSKRLELVNEAQDDFIDISMCAVDEVYTMFEPLLNARSGYNMGVSNGLSSMYAAMIIRGLKTIDDIPDKYKDEVAEILTYLK